MRKLVIASSRFREAPKMMAVGMPCLDEPAISSYASAYGPKANDASAVRADLKFTGIKRIAADCFINYHRAVPEDRARNYDGEAADLRFSTLVPRLRKSPHIEATKNGHVAEM